jgi:predicted sulfurtransferase
MRRFALSALTLAFLAIFPLSETKAQDIKFPVISAVELKAGMDSGKNLFIVDVRSKEEYMEGHLPGAVNVPPEAYRMLPGLLPSNKSYPIVFYCRGWS